MCVSCCLKLKACFVFAVFNAQKFIISLGISLQFEVYAVSTFSHKMFWGFFVGIKFSEQLNPVLSHLRLKFVAFGIHICNCKEILSFCKEASLLLLVQQIFYHVAFPLFFMFVASNNRVFYYHDLFASYILYALTCILKR